VVRRKGNVNKEDALTCESPKARFFYYSLTKDFRCGLVELQVSKNEGKTSLR
jgi:hypothetical protein